MVSSSVTGSRIGQRVFRARAEDTLPLCIEHRRLYILPTRRGWAFLGALLLMLIAAVNYSLSLGYALCFLLSGLFSATLLHTYRNLAGLELRRIRPAHAFAGGPLSFALTLASPAGRVRRGLRVVTRDGITLHANVAADGETGVELQVPTTRRGARPLGRLTLASDWPLGLWNAWSYVHAPSAGLVFPRPESDAPALPIEPDAAAGGAPGRQGARGDVAGLRPYVSGDAPATIAWKSLARGQGLHVRTFEAENGPSRTRLTLGATGLAAVEAQLSRLAAWVLAAEASRADYALELPATSLPPGRGEGQRHAALQALALHGRAPRSA